MIDTPGEGQLFSIQHTPIIFAAAQTDDSGGAGVGQNLALNSPIGWFWTCQDTH